MRQLMFHDDPALQEGGDAHCHPGAVRLAAARIFDWLDDTI
ncbi:hypothetical protein ABZX90_35705 [Streptomyces sp. NPDC002935]